MLFGRLICVYNIVFLLLIYYTTYHYSQCMATCWSIKLRRPTAHSRLWHDMTFLTFQAHRMFAIPLGKTNATSAKLEIRNCRGWFVMRSSHSNLHSKIQNCIAHRWELCEFFEHVVNMGICFLYLGHSFFECFLKFHPHDQSCLFSFFVFQHQFAFSNLFNAE